MSKGLNYTVKCMPSCLAPFILYKQRERFINQIFTDAGLHTHKILLQNEAADFCYTLLVGVQGSMFVCE